ncbi:MAG: YraN family protein [Candidatus Aminicenantes bacterium]|nr:YraN family protein [Candidatus Aminicenantes bacterium]
MVKKTIGQDGEQAAVIFLKNKGFRIIKTNYRVAGAEVDIIALTGTILCFIEVKTRKSSDYGLPEAFVHRGKQRKIIRAAKFFSSRKAYQEFLVRFDVISIIRDEKGMAFDHLENAFEE